MNHKIKQKLAHFAPPLPHTRYLCRHMPRGTHPNISFPSPMVRNLPPIFQLLHVALGRSERLVEPMSDAQWTELLDTAKKQTLTGILMEGIKRLPADQQPETETMFAWLAAAERTKQNSRRLNKAAVMLSERLLKDGFHSVILKGQGVSLLYPDPLTRTPGDIDIWMEGGRDRIVRYIRHHFPDEPVVYHHMDFRCSRRCVWRPTSHLRGCTAP